MKRVFLIVLDSFGIGAMPDAESFGDVGVNTLGFHAALFAKKRSDYPEIPDNRSAFVLKSSAGRRRATGHERLRQFLALNDHSVADHLYRPICRPTRHSAYRVALGENADLFIAGSGNCVAIVIMDPVPPAVAVQ